jgi:transposase
VKCLHKGRGIDAINEINIIPRYGGVIIHDCLAAYFSFDNCTNALCGSHLLSELAFITDSNGYAWARNMKKLLGKACKQYQRARINV